MSTSNFITFSSNAEQSCGSNKRKRQTPLSKKPVGGRPRKYATSEESKAVDRMKSRERQRQKRARQRSLSIESSIDRSGLRDASGSSVADSSIGDSDADFSDAVERSFDLVSTRSRGIPPLLTVNSAFCRPPLSLPRNPIFVPDTFTAASSLRLPTNVLQREHNDPEELEVITTPIGRLHDENWNAEYEHDIDNQQHNAHNAYGMSGPYFSKLLRRKYILISNIKQ